jgi:hypothetical protein
VLEAALIGVDYLMPSVASLDQQSNGSRMLPIQRSRSDRSHARMTHGYGHFSSSIVTATAPMAESRTLFPSTSATRLRSTK